MERSTSNSSNRPYSRRSFVAQPLYLIAGLLLGLLGLFYYANFRPESTFFNLLPWFDLLRIESIQPWFTGAIDESFPSFLHIVGISLFTIGLLGLTKKTAIWVPIAWSAIDVFFEALQIGADNQLIALGNFEWSDIAAIVIGGSLTFGLTYFHAAKLSLSKLTIIQFKTKKALFGIPAVIPTLAGVGMILGSYAECGGKSCYEPVYLSWEEVRKDTPFDSDGTMPLTYPGKQSLYGDLLLIGEKYRGIHFLDVSNPEAPEKLGFISVLGASDFIINNDYLYINSYSDLVVVNLQDYQQAPTRVIGVFPEFNPELFYYESSWGFKYDPNQGVIIGYESHFSDEPILYTIKGGL